MVLKAFWKIIGNTQKGFFCILSFIPCIYMHIHARIIMFDYYIFVVNFEIQTCKSSDFTFQDCHDYPRTSDTVNSCQTSLHHGHFNAEPFLCPQRIFFFSLTIQNKINKKKIISKTDFYFSNMKGSVY